MLEVKAVNYQDPVDAKLLVELLNGYACDPLGGETPLRDDVQADLAKRLENVPGAYSFIAFLNGEAVGLLNAFTGFSTFNAAPLINIHDVYVKSEARGQGAVDGLFAAIEDVAKALGCCKITLEVLENNPAAHKAYNRLGFAGYELGGDGGHALFWQKSLK